jgi:hypothetical protein
MALNEAATAGRLARQKSAPDEEIEQDKTGANESIIPVFLGCKWHQRCRGDEEKREEVVEVVEVVEYGQSLGSEVELAHSDWVVEVADGS